MILYNFRKRGPIEYDKYVLNILQAYNELSFLKQYELCKEKNSLLKLNDTINKQLKNNININNNVLEELF